MTRLRVLIVAGLCLSLAAVPLVVVADDGFEPNDSKEEAATISEGRHEAEITQGDVDWYAIELDAGDTLDVEAQFSHSTGDLELRIHTDDDGDDYLERKEYSFSNSDNEQAALTAGRNGTYYIEVSPDDDDEDSAPYTLVVDRKTPSENDVYEPTYSASSAASITEGRHEAEITQGDVD